MDLVSGSRDSVDPAATVSVTVHVQSVEQGCAGALDPHLGNLVTIFFWCTVGGSALL